MIHLDPDQDRVSLARRLCGRLTPTYLGLLARANAGGNPRVAVIPACFEVRLNERVAALPGETLSGFAQRWVGLSGPRTIGSIRSANSRQSLAKLGRKRGWGFPFGIGFGGTSSSSSEQASVSQPAVFGDEGPTLVIPYRTEPVAYALRRGVDADEAVATLTRALGAEAGTPVLPTPADEVEIESGVDPQYLGPALCPSPLLAEAPAWPFPVAPLLRVLERNDQVRAGNGFGPRAAATVAVVDNGVDGLFSFFPRDDLFLNELEFAATTPGEGAR